jgi:hypothetical protein
MPLDTLDNRLADLVDRALSHAIDSIRDAGGPLIPFVLTETGDERTIHRFAKDTLEASAAEAHDFVRSRNEALERAVIAWDGFVTIDGTRSDAILALAYDKHQPETYLFAQRYRPKGFLRSLQSMGKQRTSGQARI